MHIISEDDPLVKADLVDDLTKRVAELNERIARVEKFQADQRAAKAASEILQGFAAMNDYFCYIIHDSTGDPVYVGKGRGKRAALWGKRNAKIEGLISFGGTLEPVKVKENLTEVEAFECERALIAFHGREDLGTGSLLNLCDGGAGMPNPAVETRAKLSAALRARVRSPETCAKIAENNRNRSPETRAKISASNRGRKLTAETRARLSAAARNRTPESFVAGVAKGQSRQEANARAMRPYFRGRQTRQTCSAKSGKHPAKGAVLSAKPNGSAQHVAEVRKRMERVPVGEARALLELKFGRVITDMARQIRDAARRK